MVLNKKIFFVIIAAAGFLIVAFGVMVYLNWQKDKDYDYDISSGAVRERCLAEVEQMGNKELIEQINVISFFSDEELKEVNENISRYLICVVDNERLEFDKHLFTELYDRTAFFLKSLKIPEEQMNFLLGPERLGKILYVFENDNTRVVNEQDRYSFINKIAFDSIEEICPNKEEAPGIIEECLSTRRFFPENLGKFSLEGLSDAKDFCNNICDYLTLYIGDQSEFEKGLNKVVWEEDPLLLSSRFVVWTAIGFRVGGKELAEKVCDSIKEPNLEIKDNCYKYVKTLDYINCKDFGFGKKDCQQKKYEECQEFYSKTKDMICESEVRKYNQ